MFEIIVLVFVLGVGGLIGAYIRKRNVAEIAAPYKEKEEDLKEEQEEAERKVVELETKLKEVKKKIKNKTPKEIEDYWNND